MVITDANKSVYPHLFEGLETEDAVARINKLVSKWDKTGLLKGLDEVKTANMALMLENQAKELYRTMKTVLSESSSYTSDVAGFNKIAFPLVRRIFAQSIANEIVSVQPMSLPGGLLFYLNFKFDESKPHGYRKNDYVHGALSSSGDRTSEGLGWANISGAPYDLHTSYSQRFFRSGATISATDASATAWVPNEDGQLIMANRATFNFSNNIQGVDLTSLRQMEVVDTSKITNSNDAALRGFTAVKSVSAGSAALIVPGATDIHNPVIDTNGVMTAGSIAVYFFSNASLQAATGDELVFVTDTNIDNRGDFEFVNDIPEINIEIKSVPVTAQTRKLKATWTPELAQDINAYHGLDAEVELTTILGEQITTEIDREILQDLIIAARRAKMFDAWSRKLGRYMRMDENGNLSSETSRTGILGYDSGGYAAAFQGTQQEWYQTLYEKIVKMSNEIHKRTLRGAANFIVTSPDVSTILESCHSFKPTLVAGGDNVYDVGVVKTGTLSNKFKVYKDPYFPRGLILMGYKGTRFLETGYIYAPYVPLVMTPTIYDPSNFTPRKGIMTRYGKQVVRPEFFGLIYVIDLQII